TLPEDAEQLVVAGLRRMEDGEDGLGVTRAAAAGLLVRRIWRVAARVADRGRVDPGRLPEEPFGAPEAAHAEDGLLGADRERRLNRGAEDEVRRRRQDRGVAAGQRFVRRR